MKKLIITAVVLVLILVQLICIVVPWGMRKHWFSQAWFQALAQKTYDKNGIQFSYYRDWRVAEHAAAPSTTSFEVREGRLMRVVHANAPTLNIEGPGDSVMIFALCDPSYSETLETYAERIRAQYTGALDTNLVEAGPLERAACPIHGTNYIGYRYYFKVLPSAATLPSRYQYFLQLRTPVHKIMFSMQLPKQLVDSPDVNLILDSLRLDGEISPFSPIDYHLVDFENLEDSLKAGDAIAQRASGEDQVVLRAWNQTLADFIAAKQPFDIARSDFESADVLNLQTVVKMDFQARNSNAFDNQFYKRGNLALAYWHASQNWQNKLKTFQKTYDHQLHALNVNENRCASELEGLSDATGDHLAALEAAYGADADMAQACESTA